MILCYHSVSMRPDDLISSKHRQHISADLFISHLEYLKRRYHLISLDEYLRLRREGRALPEKSVVLTFDDGFRNFLTVAARLLTERNIHATVFLIIERTLERKNSIIERQWKPDDDSSYVSWPEVQALAQESGIEFGSHSHSHPRLTQIPLEEAERELRDSYAAIAEHLGYESMALAFPHGETTDEICSLAVTLGYDCALTGTLGPNDMKTDRYKLRRTVIADDDDIATFAARISGLTWWFERARSLFKRASARPFGQSVATPQPTVLDQTDS